MKDLANRLKESKREFESRQKEWIELGKKWALEEASYELLVSIYQLRVLHKSPPSPETIISFLEQHNASDIAERLKTTEHVSLYCPEFLKGAEQVLRDVAVVK